MKPDPIEPMDAEPAFRAVVWRWIFAGLALFWSAAFGALIALLT